MGSGSRKIGNMRSLAIVLLSAVALAGANPCQNNQDVYFPDREDCGRFYMCRNGEVVGHMNCPDGLLWNTDLLTCDWPRNVECTPGCPEGWSCWRFLLLPLQGACWKVLGSPGVLFEHGRQAGGDQLC